MLHYLAEVAGAMWPKLPSSLFATVVLGVTVATFSPAATADKTAPTPKPAPAPAKPDAAAPAVSLVKKPEPKNYDLTRAQQDRLEKYLPKSYPKLSRRADFHVVAVGDELMGMPAHNEDAGDMSKAWPAQFVNELSNQFLYTGGVRLIKPLKPSKEVRPLGPAITLRCLPRDGGLMTQALQNLTTYGFESRPDLVIVSYGIHDAESALDLAAYSRGLQQVVETVRAKGADLVLVAPTLTAGKSGSSSLGATRAFASAMREAAEAAGILFADPADLKSLFKFDLKTEEPADFANDALKQYRRFFTWNVEDNQHPVAELHRLIGRHIFDLLVDGSSPAPWKVGDGSATFDKAGHFTLTTEIENTGKEAITILPAGLETSCWKTTSTVPKSELKPGAKQSVSLVYELTEAGALLPPFSSHEPFLRLPLLISTGDETRVQEVHAAIKPLAILWKLDSLFNQKGEFTLENVVVNGSGAALNGVQWTAEWNGQKKSGKIDLAAGATGELPLKFDVPKFSAKDPIPLKLDVVANGVALHWERSIECTPNMGLKQDSHLVALGNTKGRVKFRTDADESSLYLIFDIDAIELEAAADGTAVQLQLSLDARSYGKRQTFGTVEPLSFKLGTADGTGITSRIAPWAFGTGYGMSYDPAFVLCRMASGRNGSRRITITLPRSYLYMHEWALGNGNSELGINTRMSFCHGGTFPLDTTFSITNNRRPETDAQGLSILELTDKPTDRWSVVIW